jgi:hypothetical protein
MYILEPLLQLAARTNAYLSANSVLPNNRTFGGGPMKEGSACFVSIFLRTVVYTEPLRARGLVLPHAIVRHRHNAYLSAILTSLSRSATGVLISLSDAGQRSKSTIGVDGGKDGGLRSTPAREI